MKKLLYGLTCLTLMASCDENRVISELPPELESVKPYLIQALLDVDEKYKLAQKPLIIVLEQDENLDLLPKKVTSPARFSNDTLYINLKQIPDLPYEAARDIYFYYIGLHEGAHGIVDNTSKRLEDGKEMLGFQLSSEERYINIFNEGFSEYLAMLIDFPDTVVFDSYHSDPYYPGYVFFKILVEEKGVDLDTLISAFKRSDIDTLIESINQVFPNEIGRDQLEKAGMTLQGMWPLLSHNNPPDAVLHQEINENVTALFDVMESR